MRQTRLIMGMPISLELIKPNKQAASAVFDLFTEVDNRYSTYKPDSEISRLNRGQPLAECSPELRQVLDLCEQTKQVTDGYFDARRPDGKLDPSGLVKGWAVQRAAELLRGRGVSDFYLEAGGDIQVGGKNKQGQNWKIGIRNPFDRDQVVKVLKVDEQGVATSGTYIRGQHIYDPHQTGKALTEVASLTVVGPNIYEADRFATAAFAMGRQGINFIESLPGFEAYMINADQTAAYTSHFERYKS